MTPIFSGNKTMTNTKTMGHPGNQYAKKPDNEVLSAKLVCLVRPEEKSSWVRTAYPRKLSSWVRDTLNKRRPGLRTGLLLLNLMAIYTPNY